MGTETKSPTVTPQIFASLSEDVVAAILVHARPQQFSTGCRIVTGGDKATHLFLVKLGRVKYYRLTRAGEEILLCWLLPGDVFGLGTLLSKPEAYVGTAEAMSDCDLTVWTHQNVRELTRKYPQLAENALRIVLHYLKQYTERHIGLVSKTAEERLATTLLRLGQNNGCVDPRGVEVHATNAQLGALADVSHFTTSRLLNGWQRKGVVQKHRGGVLIRAPEALLTD